MERTRGPSYTTCKTSAETAPPVSQASPPAGGTADGDVYDAGSAMSYIAGDVASKPRETLLPHVAVGTVQYS
jgi:hypothetical protein